MRLKLAISPHHHTGRRLPHHHSSYLILLFLLGLVGFLLVKATETVHAAPPPIEHTLEVTAEVKIAAPVILIPTNNQRFNTKNIIVSGTCIPGLTVVIYKNNILAGATPCESDGTFTLLIDLVPERNELTAQHHNPDPVSPRSNKVVVYYDVPEEPSPSTPPTTPSSPPAGGAGRKSPPTTKRPTTAFIITSDLAYRGFDKGQEFEWTIRVSGGEPPYAIIWDWGDGTSDLKSLSKAGAYTFLHRYSKPGQYIIVIKGKDVAGRTAYLQLVALVRGNGDATITSPVSPMLNFLWIIYALALLVLAVFWLGMRYELWYIKRHRNLLKA